MKSQQTASASPRAFPHLVSLGGARNIRWLIEVGEKPAPGQSRTAHAFHGKGAINDAGEVTPIGRGIILDALRRNALAERSPKCVVWGEAECTFVLADGSAVDGTRPPSGEPIYPEDYERVGVELVDVRYVRMPEDSDIEFLCIRQLGTDSVEISSGSQIMLGHFDELPIEGPGSELRRHLDAEGRLVPPATFRGVKTTGVVNGHTLLGPVQPDGEQTRVVAPWPQEVIAAAEEIVGLTLTKAIRDLLWRAVEMPGVAFTPVGAIEIA